MSVTVSATNIILKVLIVILMLLWEAAPAQLRFQKIYGFSVNDSPREMFATPDGGFIMAGRTNGIGNCYIIRTDYKGDTLWVREYGEFDVEGATDIASTNDGGYVISGYTYSFGTNGEMLIIKLDASGLISWAKTYGGTGSEQAITVRQTSDGGYIVGGASSTNGAGVEDAAVVRLDATGTILWSKRFGSINYDQAQVVHQLPDGGFIIGGSTMLPPGSRIYLMRTDANGDTLWVKSYSSTSVGSNSIELTVDGGFIVSGAGNGNAILFKTDSIGNILWSRSYGGPDSDGSSGVKQTADGGYILSGTTSSFGADDEMFLIKTDSAGFAQWSRIYGGTNDETGLGVSQTGDLGYAVFGNTEGIGGYYGYYLVKTDSDGFSNCNDSTVVVSDSAFVLNVSSPAWTYSTGWLEASQTVLSDYRTTNVTSLCTNVGIDESPSAAESIFITPNPFFSECTITKSPNLPEVSLVLINSIGQAVFCLEKSDTEVKISGDNLAAGIYSLLLLSEGKVIAAKKVIRQQ